MLPRWYRSRWFWLGLLGLVLWVGGWIASFSLGTGHAWSWSGSTQRYFLSHGGGWMGIGTGPSMAVRYPGFTSASGWRHSKWALQTREKIAWLPPVQVTIEQGTTCIWIHYSFGVAAWSVAWLVPLAGRSLPRRARPPRFPGSQRRWFASPFLWAGIPGFLILLALWIDSSHYRSYGSWRWTRSPATKPNYLGFGVESNRGQVAAWAGRPSEGFLSRNQTTGYLGIRQKSSGTSSLPGSGATKGRSRVKTTYLALTGIYLVLWSGLAATWQYRQSRLRRTPGQTARHP
jgi:hypothetical protein